MFLPIFVLLASLLSASETSLDAQKIKKDAETAFNQAYQEALSELKPFQSCDVSLFKKELLKFNKTVYEVSSFQEAKQYLHPQTRDLELEGDRRQYATPDVKPLNAGFLIHSKSEYTDRLYLFSIVGALKHGPQIKCYEGKLIKYENFREGRRGLGAFDFVQVSADRWLPTYFQQDVSQKYPADKSFNFHIGFFEVDGKYQYLIKTGDITLHKNKDLDYGYSIKRGQNGTIIEVKKTHYNKNTFKSTTLFFDEKTGAFIRAE